MQYRQEEFCFEPTTLYESDRSLLISLNLFKRESALTHEVWFSETPNTKSKRFLAILNDVEDLCFTVSILAACAFLFLKAHLDGNVLAADFLFFVNATYHKADSHSNV